jgi:hypothetical protein
MRAAGIHSQTGYAKRTDKRGGAPAVVAPNHLQRQFDVREPDRVRATDIAYTVPAKAGFFGGGARPPPIRSLTGTCRCARRPPSGSWQPSGSRMGSRAWR